MTSIFYGSRFPVVLVFVVLLAIRIMLVVSSHSFNEV